MPFDPSVTFVYGTRPEAVKMAPLIRELRARGTVRTRILVTGQHRGMVHEVNDLFGIAPDADLGIARPGQSLTGIAAAVLSGVAADLEAHRTDAVVVHGDTSTSSAAALASYYSKVPVVHLEAGLRSGDMLSPFPEEGNRRITGQLASLHLAPTPDARNNLLAENVAADAIAITGNTVIDALLHTAALSVPLEEPRIENAVRAGQRIVLVTGHRRESWDGGLRRTAIALERVIVGHPDVTVVLPLHPNPIVRSEIEPVLRHHDRAIITEPFGYSRFCTLLAASHCVVTDSGGIQEEAPSLGKPVLVTRDVTERAEAVRAGVARVIGTRTDDIERELSLLLDDPGLYARMSRAVNPYGDGMAAPRAASAIESFLGFGERMPDFAVERPVGI